MRIGLVCPYNMALGGAVQEIVKETHDELTRRGHSVSIISPHPKQGDPSGLTQDIIYIGQAKDFKTPLGTVAQLSIAKHNDIDTVLRREQFDILHMHEPWVPFSNIQILRRAICPVVATFHAKLPDTLVAKLTTTIGRPYTAPPLKHIDTCVAVSEAAAEHVRVILKAPVQIIPNAVNLSVFAVGLPRQPISQSKKTLLYIGRLEDRKGVTYLLRAFKLLHVKYPETQLIIGGDGPNRTALERQALSEDTQAVSFLGYLDDERKKELMQRADLFCAPAIYGESFGIVLIEALASGQVLVAGNNPGYTSVLKGFGAVSLVDPRDTAAHAALLEKMLYDADLRLRYKKWAKQYIQQYDYSVTTDQYETIYTKLLAKGKHENK